MFYKTKWGSVGIIILGVIIALSNGYLFLTEQSAVRGLALLAGIGFIVIGLSNLRDLRNGDLP